MRILTRPIHFLRGIIILFFINLVFGLSSINYFLYAIFNDNYPHYFITEQIKEIVALVVGFIFAGFAAAIWLAHTFANVHIPIFPTLFPHSWR